MVGLTELQDRKPAALSGGQQQRVALARVLVTKPKALLLDEPLGDLDRLLQLRMRVELRNLQRQLGLMFIHVTHNQEEALSMADRIVVMNDARIQQVADPLTIATKPATELVARFMGDNNIIRGKVTQSENGDRLVIEDEHGVRVERPPRGRSRPGGRRPSVFVSVRAAAVEVGEGAGGRDGRRTRPTARSSSSSSSAISSSSTSPPAASGCWRRCPASGIRPSGAGRARRSASPGRRRMSSSSTPDGPSRSRTSISTTSRPTSTRSSRARARARRPAGALTGAGPRLGHARLGAPRASSGSPST